MKRIRPDVSKRNHTHGLSHTTEYKVWTRIKNRCYNPKASHYNRYGGRGIAMCDRWNNSFTAFLEDVGKRPSNDHSIDRINNDGNYTPENCRWATRKEQGNNKRNCMNMTLNGETMTVTQWAIRLGVKHWTLRARRRYGWTDEKILTTPIRQGNYR